METTSSLVEPAQPRPQPALPERVPAAFTGTAGEYFRIYYVNLFLSIITLGIYAPWAKVRNRRYFYGNTSFLGASFDFDAKPWTILLSRFIILAFFFALVKVEETWGLTLSEYGFSTLAFVLVLPILLVRGRSFNLRHTLWRGVRFSYAKRFLPSYGHLFCFTLPLLTILGLLGYFYPDVNENASTFFEQEGLADSGAFKLFIVLVVYILLSWPVGYWFGHRIRISQMSFGKLDFRFTATVKSYVAVYVWHIVALLLIAAMLAATILAQPPDSPFYLMVFFLSWFGIYFFIISYFAHNARVYWNGIATTEGSRIEANFSGFTYAFWITVPNHLINIFSFGLLVPLTRVRRWRYLAHRITFLPSATLRESTAGTDSFETAIASEGLDIQGLDLDFGMI